MRGLQTGGIGFGIATASAVIALLVIGGRLAIALSSVGAPAMPIVSKVGPAEPLRATPMIPQHSSPIPAAERKAKVSRPALRLQQRPVGSVQGEPWADRTVKVEMPAKACAVERKADRTKKAGFRVSVARIAGKILSAGRKKKVDVTMRSQVESGGVREVVDAHRLAGFIVSAVGSQTA